MKYSLNLFSIVLLAAFALYIAPFAHAVTCAPTTAGNYTTATNGSCSFATTRPGVDTASGANTAVLTVAAGTTLTVSPGTTIVAGSLSLGGGTTLISGTVKIGQSMYLLDTDADTYPDSTTPTVSASSPGATYAKYWATTNYATADCGGSSANMKPGQTAYFTTANAGSWDYNCDGVTTYQYQTCSCSVCTANLCNFSCVINTTNTQGTHNCGVSESAGPSSCTRTADIYNNCISCTNAGSTPYTVSCH